MCMCSDSERRISPELQFFKKFYSFPGAIRYTIEMPTLLVENGNFFRWKISCCITLPIEKSPLSVFPRYYSLALFRAIGIEHERERF